MEPWLLRACSLHVRVMRPQLFALTNLYPVIHRHTSLDARLIDHHLARAHVDRCYRSLENAYYVELNVIRVFRRAATTVTCHVPAAVCSAVARSVSSSQKVFASRRSCSRYWSESGVTA